MRFLFLFLFYLINQLCFSQTTPELLVQLGHADRVRCIDFSSDGKFLISGGSDQILKLWQISNGQLVRTYRGQRGLIYDVKFSYDGKFVFACSWDDRRLLKFDVQTGKLVKEIRFPNNPATSLSVSKNGLWLAAACGDGGVVVFKSTDLSVVKRIPGKEISSVAFSTDNAALYITSKAYDAAKTIAFQTQSFAKLWEMPHPNIPDFVSYGLETILVGDYQKVRATEIKNLKQKFEVAQDVVRFSAARMSQDGKMTAIGLNDGGLRLVDAQGVSVKSENGKPIDFEKAHSSFINDIEFSSDGKFLATASNDWSIKIYSLSTGKVVRNMATKTQYIQSVALNPEGNLLAFAAGHMSRGSIVGIWDIFKGKLIGVSNPQSKDGIPLSQIAFNPKGKNFSACGEGLNFWKTPEFASASSIQMSECTFSCLTYSANGKNIIAGTKEGKIVFWRPDRNTNERVEVDKQGLTSIAISTDGKEIAAGSSDGRVIILNYDNRQITTTIQTHSQQTGYYDTSYVMAYGSVTGISLDGSFAYRYASVMGLGYSKDGSKLAACGGNWLKILDKSSGNIIHHIKQYGAGFSCLQFSNNGKYVCAGGADFIVRVYEVATGKLIHTFQGHQSEVRSVQFSANDKFIISGSLDTQIKIWEISTGTERLSYLLLANGTDFIITNPSGYYMSTKGANNVISFRKGNEVFPFQQFDLKYNRPDIILSEISRLAYNDEKDNPNVPLIKSYYAAYQKRIKRNGFSENDFGNELHVPEVSLVAYPPLSTTHPLLEFEVKVSDSKYALRKLNVWVNDVPIYGVKGLPLQGTSGIKKVQLHLSNQRNKITFSCINEKGTESYRESFETIFDGGVVNYSVYFIGIGINNYQDANFNLNYAAKDIKDLADGIRKVYPDAKVILLTDKDATRENILKLKEELMNTGVNDKVFVSLSGHGLLNKELDFYYATYDTDFKKPEGRGLLYDDLEGILDGIPARNKLLLVDACHSGEVDKTTGHRLKEDTARTSIGNGVSGIAPRGSTLIEDSSSVGLENSFELMQEIFSDISSGNGSVVISAAGGMEYALESDKWNNGVFTYSILKALLENSADTNADGKTIISELKKFVGDNVTSLTNGKQRPTSRRENLELDWSVW